MPTATLTAQPTTYAGPANTYRLDPPLRDPLTLAEYEHVTVCTTNLGGPRVEVFGSHPEGAPVRMVPLPGSFVLQHDVTLTDACIWALATAGGYTIAEDTEPEEVAA